MIKPGKVLSGVKMAANMWTVAAAVFAADQYFKEKIDEQPEEGFPRELKRSKGKIVLHHNRNSGFSYGFLQNKQGIIHMVTASVTSAVAGAFAYLQLKKKGLASRFGFAILSGGALSNLCDRLRKGYVVDYFSLNIKGIDKTVFNIGDFGIIGGTVIALLSALAKDAGRKRKSLKNKDL